MSRGCSNFRFGNARTTLKGGGGSGEPTSRELVQGVRAGLVGSAADEANQATDPATATSAGTMRERRRPRFEGEGMGSPLSFSWKVRCGHCIQSRRLPRTRLYAIVLKIRAE